MKNLNFSDNFEFELSTNRCHPATSSKKENNRTADSSKKENNRDQLVPTNTSVKYDKYLGKVFFFGSFFWVIFFWGGQMTSPE